MHCRSECRLVVWWDRECATEFPIISPLSPSSLPQSGMHSVEKSYLRMVVWWGIVKGIGNLRGIYRISRRRRAVVLSSLTYTFTSSVLFFIFVFLSRLSPKKGRRKNFDALQQLSLASWCSKINLVTFSWTRAGLTFDRSTADLLVVSP